MFSWFGRISYVPYTKVSDFAVHLKDGRMMGSVCKQCGYKTFPPRADCPECLSPEFEYVEYSGRGEVYTYTKISAAPTGFDDDAPYTTVLVELEEGGRLVAWQGDTISDEEIEIGMPVQVVPRIFEDTEAIKVYYSVERPATTWHKAPARSAG